MLRLAEESLGFCPKLGQAALTAEMIQSSLVLQAMWSVWLWGHAADSVSWLDLDVHLKNVGETQVPVEAIYNEVHSTPRGSESIAWLGTCTGALTIRVRSNCARPTSVARGCPGSPRDGEREGRAGDQPAGLHGKSKVPARAGRKSGRSNPVGNRAEAGSASQATSKRHRSWPQPTWNNRIPVPRGTWARRVRQARGGGPHGRHDRRTRGSPQRLCPEVWEQLRHG